MNLMNKIIIGTANFEKQYGLLNNKISSNKIKYLLKFAKKNKISYLDTADDYKIKRTIFKNFNLYKKIDLSDNFFDTGSLKEKINRYLFNDKISRKCYAVTLRKPENLLSLKGLKIMRYLLELKKIKKIKKIGISIYSTKKLSYILNRYNFDYIQLPYNILNLNILNKTKKIINGKKIEIHLRSIFLQGLLLKSKKQLPKELKKLKKNWTEIEKSLRDTGMKKISVCLNHALSANPDKIVIGVNSMKQLKEILKNDFKYIKLPKFKIDRKELIDPIHWLKFDS